MRILQVAHQALPRHKAGVEVHVDRVSRGLKKLGHEVAVLATDDWNAKDGTVREVASDDLQIFTVAHSRVARRPEDTLGSEASERGFCEVLSRFRPDVVHFQHLMYVGVSAPHFAARFGVPSLLTLHEYWLLCARGGQFRRADGELCDRAVDETCARCLRDFRFGRTAGEARIARGTSMLRNLSGIDLFPVLKRLRRSLGSEAAGAPSAWNATPSQGMLDFLSLRQRVVRDALAHVRVLLAPSRFLMQKFRDAGFPEDRLRYWPNGIPDSGERAVSAGTPTQPLRVGFLGTLVPQKGPHVLLSAAELLPREIAEIQLFGPSPDPAYASTLKAQAAKVGARLAGSYANGDSTRVLREIDVLVVPSLWFENAPLVISEAFAAGVPVIASNLGGMAELVRDGNNGRLFPPGDPVRLAEILKELALNRQALVGLREGIRPPRSLDDDVRGLEALYHSLIGAPS